MSPVRLVDSEIVEMRDVSGNGWGGARTAQATMSEPLTSDVRSGLRISYALRRIPADRFATLLPLPESPSPGDVVIGRVEKIGRNTTLELVEGRRCALHEGDLLSVCFGNRYATRQFEGYAQRNGENCELLSMGGLCGLVKTKYATAVEATKLRLMGAVGDASGHPLRVRNFALPPAPPSPRPRVLIVCGSSMDAGKTYTAMSLIVGMRRAGIPVAGIKLTGTATGNDTWSFVDAGACVALDFIDGGYASTYLTPPGELLDLHDLLLGQAAAAGAQWAVIEIADGLLQGETAALLQSSRFVNTVAAWVFATGDPLGAVGGISLLKSWGIRPVAVSGVVSMSPLAVQEVRNATGLPCLTAAELQAGNLTHLTIASATA